MSAADNERIREELERILAERGELTPDLVIEEARDPGSPLHDRFEWDDGKAAMEHRRKQARDVIRSVRINYETETHVITSFAYVHDPEAPSKQGYVSVASLRGSKDLARAAIVAEFGRAAAALKRAYEVAEVLGMRDELDGLVVRVERALVRAKAPSYQPPASN